MVLYHQLNEDTVPCSHGTCQVLHILVLPAALFSSPVCISIFYWIAVLFNHLVPVPGTLLPSCLTNIHHLSVKFLPKQDELDKAISFPHIFQTMPRMLPPAISAQLLRRELPSFPFHSHSTYCCFSQFFHCVVLTQQSFILYMYLNIPFFHSTINPFNKYLIINLELF